MAEFQGTEWFRSNILPYLNIIKNELNSLGNVTGQYAGSGATFAGLPTTDIEGNALIAGDWAILTVDFVGTGSPQAPQHPAGVYVIDAAQVWGLVQEVQDMADVLLHIFATDAEVVAGTATDKAATVDQLNRYYAKLNGTASQLFSATNGEENTQNVVTANQFATSANVSQTTACADWDAINGATDPCP